ncbi:hypothetical protein Csa_009817 [Cucumis sativus]|uniref:Uncharacterized protein n=1 Tax=Cucumis sativus TaxID=3659 RepID=A0A0A0L650_CUCSA|nr:hypothetical protein Csa_009817 [Cucumis sativus]
MGGETQNKTSLIAEKLTQNPPGRRLDRGKIGAAGLGVGGEARLAHGVRPGERDGAAHSVETSSLTAT